MSYHHTKFGRRSSVQLLNSLVRPLLPNLYLTDPFPDPGNLISIGSANLTGTLQSSVRIFVSFILSLIQNPSVEPEDPIQMIWCDFDIMEGLPVFTCDVNSSTWNNPTYS